jgi:tetratricopeptide (TPR) repeat protein
VRLVREGLSILRRLGARRQLARYGFYGAYVFGPEHNAEAWQLLQETLTTTRELGDRRGTADILGALGELAVRQGAYDKAEGYCQEALRIGREIDASAGIGALVQLGKVAYHRGEYSRARGFYEEYLDTEGKLGFKFAAGYVCSYLGDTALAMADYEQARERHQEARALFQEMDIHWGQAFSGEHWGLAYSLDRLGDVALAVGDVEEAKGYYQQALLIARDYSHVALELDVLVSQAALLAQKGHEERSVELAALALHHPASDKEVTGRAQALLRQLEGKLSPAVHTAAQDRGRARDLETTVKELLARKSE